ncbi:MAG: hypothetical protein HZB57_12370 [Gammaproteobacteria bacterium]|nr:hypothetical protein [Gammaproteobacteria bacterium]
MNKFTVACALLMFSSGSFAGVWTDAGKVVEYYANGNGGVALYISVSSPLANPLGCSSVSYYRLESANPAFKEITALLLAAKASSGNVRLYIDDVACSLNYPKILHARLV